MRGFIVLCLCATVLAAPQGGYLYNQQQGGLPARQPSFSSNSQESFITNSHANQGFVQQTLNSGAALGGATGHHNTQQFSYAPNVTPFLPSPQQNFAYNGIQQQQQQQQAPLISNFAGQQQQFNGFQQQQYQTPTSVTKDIYVHVAPEDSTDQQYQQQNLPPPPARKHYRIVFIKAPSQSVKQSAVRVQQAPIEEKTIIYVLTKKPDPVDLQAAIQQIQPKQPTKPEVYFIKYKTHEEAQHAQRTIQAQYDKLGGTSQISDEGIAPITSVVGSLDGGQRHSSLQFSNASGHSSSSSVTSSSSSSLNTNGGFNTASKYLPPIVKL